MVKQNCSYFLSGILSKNFYIFFSFILLIGIQYYFLIIDKVKGWGRVGLVLIFIGGASNLTERVIFGCVKDYINFFDLFYYNVFDIFVTLGLIIFGVHYFRNYGK